MDGRADLERLVRDLTNLARARPDEALRRCRKILEQAPDTVPLLALAGRLERQSGHPDVAEQLLRRALEADPDAGPVHGELGLLAATRGSFELAAGHFDAWTRAQPAWPDPWFNLGLAEERCGRYLQAAAAYRRAIDVSSDAAVDVRLRLAGVLAMAGQESDARREFARVLDLDSDSIDARFGLGLLDLADGETDAAMDAFRTCVAHKPTFADAWQEILAMRRITDPADPDLRAVRALLEQSGDNPLAQERLSFAIGKALDDLAQHDEAFAAYSRANRLKRARLPRFDADSWRTRSERQPEPAPLPLPDDDGPRPCFVIGMPRSGTTLVDQIITAHPQATGVGELPFLDGVLSAAPEAEAADRLLTARGRYMERLRETGALVVSNKYPSNFRHLPLIWRLFPDAPVVHVTRSPLDTCLSIYFQDFPTGNLYANSLDDIGAYYRQYRRLMERVEGHARLLTVAYEDLVADQESVSRRLVAHCGLSWDPACLDFAANRRPVGTLSRWQVRQPLYGSSIGRWRNYRSHLAPLIESLGRYADVD